MNSTPHADGSSPLPQSAGAPDAAPQADGRTWDQWAQGQAGTLTASAAGLPGEPGVIRAADPQPELSPGSTPEAGPPGAVPSGAGHVAWPSPPPNPSPRWARWALAALMGATAGLYMWGLSRNGWANAYYSAAAQAGGESWKAWFFGSFDAANAITVDKPPASLWLMGLSVRIFGLSSWSVLVPQALLGVASVGVLYATVRRWFAAPAGLIAGAVLALTPVAALMFRFNNPDALLVFLLVCAAWAMGRATERASLRWIMLAGAFVGFAFLAKMLQAFLVLPGFVAMYAVAAPTDLRRRIGHLFAAFATMIVAGGWWVAIVELWPAASRPYIGGSQTNSIVELIFGYNGFGRITGDEVGSVGGAGGQGGRWGETGLGRLFSASYGGQIAWLLPAALAMIAVLLWVCRRGARSDLTRAAVLGWGGWLVVTGAVISFSQGIIHEYYTVALAPAIGALVGIGSAALWAHRQNLWARAMSAALIAGTAWWSVVLLGRSDQFLPWLPAIVLIGGLVAAGAVLMAPKLHVLAGRRIALTAGVAGLIVALAGPAAYSLETAATSASGSLPSAGPAVAGARGGPGGARGGAPGGGQGSWGRHGQLGTPPGLPSQNGTIPNGTIPNGTSLLPGPGSTNGFPGQDGIGRAQGGAGSLLNGSTPSAALTEALLADAGRYTWVAAAVGANSAAGYQLATEQPVLAIGGFNGSDPSPTLAEFQELVAEGRIHYFIGGGMGRGGMGAPNSGSGAGSDIPNWVAESFTATTIGGTTVYDLTQAAATASGTGVTA